MAFRILHCLRAPVGGLFRHVRDLAEAQAARGHQVGILCDATTGGEAAQAALAQLASFCTLGIRRVPMSRLPHPRDLTAFRAVHGFAREAKITILHGHGAKGGAYARLAARALSRKTHGQGPFAFYTPHAGSLHYTPESLKGRLFLGLERALLPLTQGLICESAFSRETFFHKVGKPSCPVRVIYNGLHPQEFQPHAPREDAADFLFIGELRHLKGVDVFLKALAHLPAAQAVIVGDGPDAAAFHAQAETLSLTQRVRFLGALPARQAFSMGRCLVMPSRAESLPYVILEAGAAAMPLLATHVGGIPEITGDSGVALIPPDDSDALAAQMSAFLSDPSPFQTAAQRLQARLRQGFTVAAMTEAILAFYDDVAASVSKRRTLVSRD